MQFVCICSCRLMCMYPVVNFFSVFLCLMTCVKLVHIAPTECELYNKTQPAFKFHALNAEVTAIVDNSCPCNCMIASKSGWRWPEKRDEIWYDVADVVKKLGQSVPVTSRVLYKFTDIWYFITGFYLHVSSIVICFIFIVHHHTDMRYWYSKSVCLSVRPSVHLFVRPLRSGTRWKRLNISS